MSYPFCDRPHRIKKLQTPGGTPLFWRVPGETLGDALALVGVEAPPAQTLDDDELTTALWRVIVGMEALGCFLRYTDHLSDRELYLELTTETFHDELESVDQHEKPGFRPNCRLYIMLDNTDSTDNLSYYADESERQWYVDAGLWEGPLPERKPFVSHRDHLLPEMPRNAQR